MSYVSGVLDHSGGSSEGFWGPRQCMTYAEARGALIYYPTQAKGGLGWATRRGSAVLCTSGTTRICYFSVITGTSIPLRMKYSPSRQRTLLRAKLMIQITKAIASQIGINGIFFQRPFSFRP
jgi:hypothetical protein